MIRLLLLICSLLFLTSFIGPVDPNCGVMKKGKFKFLDADDKTAYFEINKDKLVEYYQNKKYYVKADLKWLNDCKYELSLTAATLPKLGFKPGDKLTIEIVKVSHDTVTYKGTSDKRVWLGLWKVMK
jgi:hypothetical protein